MSRPALYLADGPRYVSGSAILAAVPDWVDAPWTESRQSAESRLSLELPQSVVRELDHTQPGRFLRQDFGDRIVEWIVGRRQIDASRSMIRLDLVPIHHLLRWAPIRRQRVGFPADTAVAAINLNAREMIGSWVVPTMTAWGFDIFRTGRIGVSERRTVGMDGWTPLELLGWMAEEYGVAWDLRADDDDGVYRIDFGWVDDTVDYEVVLTDPGALLSYSQSEDLSATHTSVLVTGATPRGGSQPSTLGTATPRVDSVAFFNPANPNGETLRVAVSIPGSDEPAVLEDGQWVGRYVAWTGSGGDIAYAEIVASAAPGVLSLASTATNMAVGTPVTVTTDTAGTRPSTLESPTGLGRLGSGRHLVGMVDGRGRGEQNYHIDPFHVDADFRGQIWDGTGTAGDDYCGVYVGVRYPVPPRLTSPSLSSTSLPSYNLQDDGPLDTHIEVDVPITVTGWSISTPAGGLEARLIVLEGSSFGAGTEIFNEDIGRNSEINHIFTDRSIALTPGNAYTFRIQYQSGIITSPSVRIRTSGVSYPYQTSTSQPADIGAIVGSSEGSATLGPLYDITFTTSALSGATVHGLPPSVNLNSQLFNPAARLIVRDFYVGGSAEYRPRYQVATAGVSTSAQGTFDVELEAGEDADTEFTRPHYVYFFTGESNAPGVSISVIFFPDGTSATSSRQTGAIGGWQQPGIPRDQSSGTVSDLPRAQIGYRPPESMGGPSQSARFQGLSQSGVLTLTELPPGYEIWPGDIIQTGTSGTDQVFRCQAWGFAQASPAGQAQVRCIWIDRHWTREPNDLVRVIRPPAIPPELIGQSHWVTCTQLIRELSPTLAINGTSVRKVPASGSRPGVGVFAGAIQCPMWLPSGVRSQSHTLAVWRGESSQATSLASVSVSVDHGQERMGQMLRQALAYTWPDGTAGNAGVYWRWQSPDSASASRPFTLYTVGRNLFEATDEEVPMVETSHANVLLSAGQRALRRYRYGLIEPTARIVDLVRRWDLPTQAAERLRPGSRVRVQVPAVGIDEVFEVNRVSRDGDGEAVVHFEARSNRISRQVSAPGRTFASVVPVSSGSQTTEVQRTRPIVGLPAKSRPSLFFPDPIPGSDPSPPEVNLGFD